MHQPAVSLAESPGVKQEAEQHNAHGEKCANTEANQQRRRFRFVCFAMVYLVGQAASVAAELMRFAVHLPLQSDAANGQQAVAACANSVHKPCKWAVIGNNPRTNVMIPSMTMKPPAMRTLYCRQSNRTTVLRPSAKFT